jgi:hypothetical protein
MRMAGYSGTPLAKKLGIKPGARVYVENAPEHYLALLEPLPADVFFSPRLTGTFDLIHFFTKEAKGLTASCRFFNALWSKKERSGSHGPRRRPSWRRT